jgi:16S rRNA (cytosine967-C5)-methyltransferase
MPISSGRDRGLTHRPNARGYAAALLHQIAYGGRSLDRVLREASPTEQDRTLIHELTIGATRHFFSLSEEVSSRLSAPLKTRDSIVLCLLLIGAYQLRHTRIPNYAAVNETVAATRQIGRPWARGLVNQVLRRIGSEPALSSNSEQARFDHPQWLIDLIRQDYPDRWTEILAANQTRAPLSLRVNLSRTTRAAFLDMLATQGVSAHCGETDECVVLTSPRPTAAIPGLAAGLASVQDVGAMRAADLLRPVADERVLDACAAPGGKAMHLLERTRGIRLTAIDIDAERCELIRNECARLDFAPTVVGGDAAHLDWWDRKPFARVLLDVPCSGTGTLRRHPDIKLLKHASDIDQYQSIQMDLLHNLWRVIDTGGHILYCTCSILSRENDQVIDRFLQWTPTAAVETIEADWGIATRHGRQIVPRPDGADGFYFSLLTKQPPQ